MYSYVNARQLWFFNQQGLMPGGHYGDYETGNLSFCQVTATHLKFRNPITKATIQPLWASNSDMCRLIVAQASHRGCKSCVKRVYQLNTIHMDGLDQDCSNSSALAKEFLQSCVISHQHVWILESWWRNLYFPTWPPEIQPLWMAHLTFLN